MKKALFLFVATAATVAGGWFLLTNTASAQTATTLEADKFFCNTRYSRNIDDQESARREACQKGYEGEDCGAGDDDDEVYVACMAGVNAEKPIPDEPDDIDMSEIPEPEPPELDTTSIAGTSRCGGIDTAYVACPSPTGTGIAASPIWVLLNVFLNIAVAFVGIAAVGGLIYAGMMYSSAGDNQDRVKKAKTLMVNITIGLVVFAAMYILLQFIIPGGIF